MINIVDKAINRIETWCDPLPNAAKGIGLALISTALFSMVAVIVRDLSAQIDVFEILFFRQLVFVCLLLPAISKSIPILLNPNKVSLHLLRVVGAFIALYFGFVTVSYLPLADATALGFTQVLFVAAISRVFLSEQVNRKRMFTIVVGFIGVLLVVQPKFTDASIQYVFYGLLAALGAATAVICVRKVSQTEPKITLLAYQAIFVGSVAFIPSLSNWTWPQGDQWLLLLLVGVLSSMGQWVGISAYKWAEANIIANVEYVKIIYAMGLGFLFFGEIPNTLAFLGAAVIILSAVIPTIISKKSNVED